MPLLSCCLLVAGSTAVERNKLRIALPANQDSSSISALPATGQESQPGAGIAQIRLVTAQSSVPQPPPENLPPATPNPTPAGGAPSGEAPLAIGPNQTTSPPILSGEIASIDLPSVPWHWPACRTPIC